MHYLFYPVSLFSLLAFFVIKDVPGADSGAAFMIFIVSGFLGVIAQALDRDSEAREAKLKQQVWDVARAYEEELSEGKSNQSKVEPKTPSKRFVLSKWHLTYGDSEISVDTLRIEIRDGVEGVTALNGYSLPGGREWVSKQEIAGDFNYLYQTSAANRLWGTEVVADDLNADTKKKVVNEKMPASTWAREPSTGGFGLIRNSWRTSHFGKRRVGDLRCSFFLQKLYTKDTVNQGNSL